jgi:hypothetical protein
MSSLKDATKAPFYPSIYYRETRTIFGAIETDHPDLYTRPLFDKKILIVDTLAAISTQNMWGESILSSEETRNLAYQLVSGSCSEEKLQRLMASFYAKHKKFTDYVDNAFHFGDKSTTLLTRIVRPARQAIAEYTENALLEIGRTGGRVVMLTHDYVYATYRHANLPTFEHSRVIPD